MQNVHYNLKLNASLLKVAQKVRAEAVQSQRRPKKIKRDLEISDQQVLQIRALKEFANWKPRIIAKRMGLDINRVYKIISYEQRSKLVPKKTDLPKL